MVTQQKPAVIHFMDDVLRARIRMIGARDVVKHQHNPRHYLHNKDEQQTRSKRIGPSRPAGNGLIQHFGLNGFQPDSFIDKVDDFLKCIGCVGGIAVHHALQESDLAFDPGLVFDVNNLHFPGGIDLHRQDVERPRCRAVQHLARLIIDT